MIEASRKFLGTFDGEEIRWPGINGQLTYARVYRKLGGSDELRDKLLDSNAVQCLELGTQYAIDRRNKFSFKVVKQYVSDDQQRLINCYRYALSTFGEKLEKISGVKMEVFQMYVREKDIFPIVENYFENVDEPRDGDLVVCTVLEPFYWQGLLVKGDTHAGICRFNSKGDLCIESKWGYFQMPYVFEHLPFFSSKIDGDLIRCFRLKEVPVERNAFAKKMEDYFHWRENL